MTRALVLLASVGVALAGCAASGAGPNVGPPLEAEDFCETLVRVICEADAECCESSATMAECVADQRTRCDETLGALVADPRAGYVPERGGYLLETVEARASDCWAEPFELAELDAMFEGTGVAGADCSPTAGTTSALHVAALSCDDGTACRTRLGWDDAAEGTCEVREVAGDDLCSHPFDCGAGEHCNLPDGWRVGDWGRCQPLRIDGWSCRAGYECASGWCGPEGCAERPESRRCLELDYRMLVLASAPIAYYRLGEHAGTSAVDASGNGNAGTYVEPVDHGDGALEGDDDGALVLDGMGGRVAARDLDGLVPDAITVELWVMRAEGSAGGPLLELNTTDASLALSLAGPALRASFLVPDDDDETEDLPVVLTSADGAVGDGFHHVALTYANEVTRLFVDGVEVATLAGERTIPEHASLLVGYHDAEDPDATASFAGTLDELAIHPVALPAASLAMHVTAGRAGPIDNEHVLFSWSR